MKLMIEGSVLTVLSTLFSRALKELKVDKCWKTFSYFLKIIFKNLRNYLKRHLSKRDVRWKFRNFYKYIKL